MKGFFGNCNQLFITIGILLTYFFGIDFNKFTLTYSHMALIAAGLVALFEILMLTTYETPRWLFSKDMDFTGIRVLRVLRGNQFHISREIDSIKARLRHTYSTRDQLMEFRKRPVLHPFVLVILMMVFQQFSGINAAIFYASQIFTDAGFSNNKANLVSFGAVGCVQVLSTFISVVLVDFLGRRILLIASSVGMITSSVLLGVYFWIFERTCSRDLGGNCPDHIEYLAIVGIIIFISSFSFGWGPIPWSSMSELLPSRVRTLGGSIATLVNWASATIVLFVFPIFTSHVGGYVTWWCFSAIMVLSIVFVVFFVPEARGHSLMEEIQQHFESGSIILCPYMPQEL